MRTSLRLFKMMMELSLAHMLFHELNTMSLLNAGIIVMSLWEHAVDKDSQ